MKISAFENYKNFAKMIFLGVDLRYMTYVHYVEFMVGVPHRYNKLFLKPVMISPTNLVIGFEYLLNFDALETKKSLDIYHSVPIK